MSEARGRGWHPGTARPLQPLSIAPCLSFPTEELEALSRDRTFKSPCEEITLTLLSAAVLPPALGGSPPRVPSKVGQGWFLFLPSLIATRSLQPVWSSCKGVSPISPQPYAFPMSSLPEEAKRVLEQRGNATPR